MKARATGQRDGRPLRILYHHRIASRDGQYVHVDELTRALRRQGHELVMVGPAVGGGEFGGGSGLVARLKRHVPAPLYELMEFGYAFLAFARLLSAGLRQRPDVIYERYNLFLPAGVWVSRWLGVPLLLEVNAPLFRERSAFGGIRLRRLARWSEDYTWRRARQVLPVTAVLAEAVAARGVERDRITVIPNGIDPRRFASCPDAGEAKRRLGLDGRTVLGFTGFVRDWHGLDRVVELLQPGRGDRDLLIVGDGPAAEGIRQRARELGVADRVTITGVVPRERIPEYVMAFDIALQPDVVDYASPLKLFEYLALGRAIVAPDKPNIREVLADRENAVLFEPGNMESFQAGIEALCRDPALRDALGRAARATIDRRQLTWERNAERVTELARAAGSS